MKIARMYCQRCESDQKCVCIGANHLLHLALCFPTFGLWLIVWFFVAREQDRLWNCDVCGVRIAWESMDWRQKPKPQKVVTPDSGEPESEPARYDLG